MAHKRPSPLPAVLAPLAGARGRPRWPLSTWPVLGVDPGPRRCGLARLTPETWRDPRDGPDLAVDAQVLPLDETIRAAREVLDQGGVVVLERLRPYGLAVGESVFRTTWVSGWIAGALVSVDSVWLVGRGAVKTTICGQARAKDANVRRVLLDAWAPWGSSQGREPAVGTKREPGPLYGVHGDAWAALAVAVAWIAGADGVTVKDYLEEGK